MPGGRRWWHQPQNPTRTDRDIVLSCPADKVGDDDEVAIKSHEVDDSELVFETIKDSSLCFWKICVDDILFIISPSLWEFDEISRGEFFQRRYVCFISLWTHSIISDSVSVKPYLLLSPSKHVQRRSHSWSVSVSKSAGYDVWYFSFLIFFFFLCRSGHTLAEWFSVGIYIDHVCDFQRIFTELRGVGKGSRIFFCWSQSIVSIDESSSVWIIGRRPLPIHEREVLCFGIFDTSVVDIIRSHERHTPEEFAELDRFFDYRHPVIHGQDVRRFRGSSGLFKDSFVVFYSLRRMLCPYQRRRAGRVHSWGRQRGYGIWCVFFEGGKIYLWFISDITIEIGMSGELDEVL